MSKTSIFWMNKKFHPWLNSRQASHLTHNLTRTLASIFIRFFQLFFRKLYSPDNYYMSNAVVNPKASKQALRLLLCVIIWEATKWNWKIFSKNFFLFQDQTRFFEISWWKIWKDQGDKILSYIFHFYIEKLDHFFTHMTEA